MRRLLRTLLVGTLAWAALPQAAAAQDTAASGRQGALRLFLDCDWCDETFLRTEITFVDYVRDRKDADVHALVTTQQTGGGGTEYTFKFIGLGRFLNVEQSLRHVVPQTATSDERRRSVADVLKRGLVRYVADTPLGARLKITFAADAAEKSGQADPKKDPWNLWVFRTSFGGSVNGERSNKGKSIRGSLSANRTTADWKLGFSASANYRDSTFELSETETFQSVSRNFDSSGRVVKSINEHWSVAAIGTASSSTFVNQDLHTRLAAGLEYDIFPYSQSTRRLLTLQYTVGHNHFDYEEETVFFKMSEQLIDHRLTASLSMRQTWGSAFADVTFSQYLNQTDAYNISAFGSTDVRIYKGLSFNMFASVGRPRDQLYLPRAGATAEEILVRQQQLATTYRYSLNFGLSYSFGSIFNNIVNPRFGSGGGEFFFFF